MNKWLAVLIAMAAAFAFLIPAVPAHPVGIPILIDLTHGQGTAGIETMIKVVPEAQWYILVPSQEAADSLPPLVKNLATEILVGDLASVDLNKYEIEMVIIGQPQALFTPQELTALASWFKKYPNRAIWLAADSDYPAQGSETAQKAVNMVLEALNAHLRMDYVSVEDSTSCAGKPYRVIGILDNCEIPVLKFGASKVLFHGPGAVAWVDDSGNWHKLTASDKPSDAFIIATTTSNGLIVEHQAAPNGVTGKAYKAGETGVFTLMAAELVPVGSGKGVVIVSGETPYGGYQPCVTWMYHGKRLSGPQFFRNVILWATGYMGPLSAYESLTSVSEKLSSEVSSIVDQKVSEKMSSMDAKISQLASTVNTKLGEMANQVNAALASVSGQLTAALALGVVSLIIAIAALAVAIKKK